MSEVDVRLVIRDYDQISPLVTGDVVPSGIKIILDRTTPISRFREDESFQAGEMSFAGYLRLLSSGDTSIIGLPIFVFRGFRQRCFYVRRGSSIRSLSDLIGKRIGTNGWPDSGNTWSRALLRAENVPLESIDWWVGTTDGITDQKFGHQVAAPSGLRNVTKAPEGNTLQDMLLAEELDALMIPWPPQSFYEFDAPVVRLLADYRSAEQAYARQVRFWPAHHLIGVRSTFVRDHPEVAPSLFEAFERSRIAHEQRCWMHASASPWQLTDVEQAVELLGPHWQANGIEPNRDMISAFSDELHAQGIIDQKIAPEDIFAEFQAIMNRVV